MRRGVVLAVVVVAATAAITISVLRSREERRLANLQACLFGEALARGEPASRRYRAIELARPYEKLKASGDTLRRRLVPANPIPPEERWPSRCEAYARAATSHAWLVSPGLTAELTELAAALGSDVEPENLDATFREGRLREVPAAAEVKRPWAPVVFAAPPPANADVEALCPAQTMLATLDHWDDDLVLLGGEHGCAVTAAGNERLAAVRRRAPTDATSNVDRLVSSSSAVIAGRAFTREADHASWGEERLGEATTFRTCASSGARAILLENVEKRTASVHFVDANGSYGGASFPLIEPEFAGRGGFRVALGARTMSCRGREARVAWSWSTAIDQRSVHEVTVATCTPSGCTSERARVRIDTPHQQECGYCATDPDVGSVAPVRAVDLFEGILLLWSTGTTVRARIAPLPALEAARDVVLWYEPGGAFEDPAVIARGSLALVGLRLTKEAPPAQSRLLRVEAGAAGLGVRTLAP